MLSPENIPANPSTTDDNQSSGSRKTSSLRPPEQPQKCPRCDSPNTKFCYYNNYSLAQPRHFCKTCRRYWTKGGALRNVPIGGGCRKNKRTKSASRLSGDSKDTAATSDAGGLKFFHGLSPTMDFQFGGRLPFSRPLFSSASGGYNNHFVSFGDLSSAAATATNPPRFHIDDGAASSGSSMGFQFHFPVPPGLRQGESGDLKFQEMYSMNVHSSLASSIESLSYVNQDLHWKLQQQRLAMLLGGENQKDGGGVSSHPSTLLQNQTQKSQPISFQNLEIPNLDVSDASNPTKSGLSGTTTTTEWLFENSYNPAGTTTNINSSSNGNGTSNWNGIQAWTDLHQYSALP